MNIDYSFMTDEQFITFIIGELKNIEYNILNKYNNLTTQKNNAIDYLNKIRREIARRKINVSIPKLVDYDDKEEDIVKQIKQLRKDLDSLLTKTNM